MSLSSTLDALRRPPEALQIIAAALLPGVLAGIQMGGLLFFLNPDLPFAAGPVVRATLVFATLWGLLSLALLLPLTWGRFNRSRRMLPWSIVTVLAICALIDWLHASHLSYYMTSGINTRLIKAALWLSATALAGFYTALLHSLHRRPYGIRSRLLMTFLVLLSVYVMIERREAFRPLATATPRPSRVEPQPRPELWVVGVGGATLDALLPLVQEGRLPFFARLLESGAYGRLQSYGPRRDAALWTSLATGKLPHRHGVLDDRTYDASFLHPGARLRLAPVGAAFTHWGMLAAPRRRVDATSTEVLPAWRILHRLGVRCGLVGWPLTDPVTDAAAFAFSDRFFEGQFGRSSAQPKELAERGTLFRTLPEEIEAEASGLSPASLAALAQDLWRESLTDFLLDQGSQAQAFFVHLPGLAGVSRNAFSGYYAVQFEGKQNADAQQAARDVISYYEAIDRRLEQLLGDTTGNRLVAIVSAYGYESHGGWGRLVARLLEGSPWSGTADRAPDGIFLLDGPGVEPGAFLSPAEVTDVLPTLLYAMGLPIARDLDGRVLTAAFRSEFLARQALTFVPSYETLAAAEDEPATAPIVVTPETLDSAPPESRD